MDKTYRYAMLYRPAGPGAQPRDGLIDTEWPETDADDPRFGHRVWSIVTYNRKLTDKEISDYELTPIRDFHDLAQEMEAGSWFTIIGTGGDLDEWKIGVQEMMNEQDIGTITRWEQFSGREMNTEYGLTGNNAYSDDLTFIAFPLDGLDVGRLAMFKLQFGARWFDDIVDNNKWREDQKKCLV